MLMPRALHTAVVVGETDGPTVQISFVVATVRNGKWSTTVLKTRVAVTTSPCMMGEAETCKVACKHDTLRNGEKGPTMATAKRLRRTGLTNMESYD
jgi:hypothetical protein